MFNKRNDSKRVAARSFLRPGLPLWLTAGLLLAMAGLLVYGVSVSEAQTQETGPIGPPRDVESVQGVNSVEVGWNEPAPMGETPTGYRVRWRDDGAEEETWQPSADGVALPASARSHKITGLERSHYPRVGKGHLPLVRKSYTIQVAADTSSGIGEWASLNSGELQGTTAPEPPLNLAVSRDERLSVSWEVPTGAGQRVQKPFDVRETNRPPDPKVASFYVRWRQVAADGQSGAWQGANGGGDLGHQVDNCTERVAAYNNGYAVIERTCTTEYAITGLEADEAYEVQVRTLNDIGVTSAWAESPLMLLLTSAKSVGEGDGSIEVVAKLNMAAPSGGVQVTLQANAEDTGTARQDIDYILPGAFTIAEGELSASAAIRIKDDAVNERDETVNLTPSVDQEGIAVTGMSFAIVDDEVPPEISDRYTASRFYTPGSLTLTAGDGAITAQFAPALRNDITYWLQWRADDNPAWTTVQAVSSPHRLDNLANGERHHVRVAGIDFNSGFGPPWVSPWVESSAVPDVLGPIPQSASEMTLSVVEADASVAENGGTAHVRATLYGPAPSGGVSVRLVFAAGDSGTAAPGVDYFLPEPFVIPAGKQEAVGEIEIVDNAVNAADKTLGITAITNLASIKSVTPDPLVITIRDDEPDYVDPPERQRRWLRDEWKVQNLRVRPGDGRLTVAFDPPAFTNRVNRTYWLQWRAEDNPLWTTVKGAASGHVIENLDNGVGHLVRVTNLQQASVGTPSAWGGWIQAAATPNEPNTITVTVDRGEVREDGGAVRLTAVAVLDSSISGSSVQINLASGSGATATEGADYALPKGFFIPAGGYTVSGDLRILDDAIDEDLENIVLEVSTDPALKVAGGDIEVAINDNDAAGVTIQAEPTLSVWEAHGVSYAVVLNSRPTVEVTVTPVSSDPAAATAGSALTFTPENWDEPQTVSVVGTPDDDKSHETVTIIHTVTSGDGKYDGISPSIDGISVEVTDDDLPTLTFEFGSQVVGETDAEFRHSPRLWIRNAGSGDNSISVSMGLDTTGRGTATWSAGSCDEGVDYFFPSRFAGFSLDYHGSSAFVTVGGLTICGDDEAESDETLILYLAPRSDQYNIVGSGELVITIRDDDTGGL